MKKFIDFICSWFCFDCHGSLIVGTKRVDEIECWLETHGIERSTAAQVMGFLAAYGIKLGQIRLCTYGLTYSFDEFLEWWRSPSVDLTPQVNKYAVFWNDSHGEAVIGIYKEQDAYNNLYIDVCDRGYRNACLFRTMSEYRMILNTPDDRDIALPLGHLGIVASQDSPKDEVI